jgi:hypothetical protein
MSTKRSIFYELGFRAPAPDGREANYHVHAWREMNDADADAVYVEVAGPYINDQGTADFEDGGVRIPGAVWRAIVAARAGAGK